VPGYIALVVIYGVNFPYDEMLSTDTTNRR